MNRHQRRAASKSQDKPVRNPTVEPEAIQESRGLALRIAASILLSRWVLRRVHNPQVLSMLREVALQAGRQETARHLDERLNQPA